MRKYAAVLAGLVVFALALALPREWYDAIPKPPGTANFPVDGVTLLRGVLLADSALLLAMGVVGWRYRRVDCAARRAIVATDAAHGADWAHRDTVVAVALLALAVVLRVHRLDSDFWLDEISTLGYARLEVLDLLTRYSSPNNHLLNSLLIKASVGAFGPHEWAVRLPAALLGAATVPVLYWIARRILPWQGAAMVALLLAVSYHHVFFSQNARGYVALLLFSLAATGFLIQALARDRLRDWALYAASLFLAFASMINAAYVLAAHLVVSALVVARCAAGGGPWRALAMRLAMAQAAVLLLVAHLYALLIPQIAAVVNAIYSEQSSGYRAFSLEFLRELVRGLGAGFGPGFVLGAVPVLLAGLGGLAVMARRDWVLTLLLTLPPVVTAAHLAVKGLSVSPRFFLFALFAVLIAAVAAMWAGAGWAARRWGAGSRARVWLATALGAVAVAVSASALPRYYAVPKQSYRAAIDFLASEDSRVGPVLVIRPADVGLRFYAARSGAGARLDLRPIREAGELGAALDGLDSTRVRIVTTLERLGRIDYPSVYARLDRDWQPVRKFPASVGGGELVVWRPKGVAR